jgi:hypothetical protein
VRVLLAAFLAAVSMSCGAQSAVPAANHVDTSVRDLTREQVVDGVPCLVEDLPPVHLHVHLSVLLDGKTVTVPAGIGVGRPWGYGPPGFIATGRCFAWIHTHDTSGVVHVFTQVGRAFTLRQLFEVWGRPLEAGGALGYSGQMTVLASGRQVEGDPGALPLTPFEDIVIELGKPPAAPPVPYDFGAMRA